MKDCFVIAEAGVNHNGSADLAIELVDIAAESGADAIKFQTFSADKLVRLGAEKAEYQKRETGDGDQYSMLKKLEISPELHLALIERCEFHDIEFMSTAFDEEALDFLIEHGMKRIKVPSGELTNHPFLRYIAAKNLPIIMSTGMASLEEIVEAKSVIEEERERLGYTAPIEECLTILHCTSNYPADAKDVNLNAMKTIATQTGIDIGYSDHTLGVAVSTAAVALGAVVIEKHFTKSRDLPGPDHSASLEPAELKALISQIRTVEIAMGSFAKQPTESELSVRSLVRRSVTTRGAVSKGSVITENDLILMRPGSGIQPKELGNVIGRVAADDLAAGKTLNWSDVK